MPWSSEQALSFAPDIATARKGEDLAAGRFWEKSQHDNRFVWGNCKSSSTSVYQTQIDLDGPAFNCNCPSRKFPCKHAIGLFLLFINNPTEFVTTKKYPDWVQEWMGKRGVQILNDAQKFSPEELKKLEQKQKRRTERIALMISGAKDLEIWLGDLVRQGLAATEGQPYNYWQGFAALMVDAKLGGVGRRIRKFPLLHTSGSDWPEQMLSELAQLYLIVKGFENLEELPPLLQTELLTIAGLDIQKKDVLPNKGIHDDWLVMGVIEGVEENLNFRHTWLSGANTEQFALVLDYSFGDEGYQQSWQPGQAFNGEVVYYPSAYPIRALVKSEKGKVAMFEEPKGFHSLDRYFDSYSKALVKNPWINYFPCYLQEVIPVMEKGRLYILDADKKNIEALPREHATWKLVALSGGQPVNLFGEWSGEYFIPLSVLKEGNVIGL